MRIGIICGVLLVAASLGCGVIAADNPKVALDANEMPIDQAMADLAKQAGVQIVCDTGVKGSVTGRFQDIELEKLLSAITKSNGLAWQKLYIPPAKEDEKLSTEQIRARAEAIAALAAGTMVVVDAATGKEKVFVEQDAATPSVEPEKLGLTCIYLVSKPKAEPKPTLDKPVSGDTAKQFQSLQAQRVQLLAQMTPEERVAAMQSEMMLMMNMDPTVRGQMMADQMRARREMPQEMRDQYHQMMHDTFRSMRESGQIQGDWRGRGDRGDRGIRGDRGDRGNRN